MSEQVDIELSVEEMHQLVTFYLQTNLRPESIDVFDKTLKDKTITLLLLQKAVYDAIVNEAVNEAIERHMNEAEAAESLVRR